MSFVKDELTTLLKILSGDLNYDNIRAAKDKLGEMIDEPSRIVGGLDSLKKYPGRDVRGCLCSAKGRGDCKHFVGLPKVEDCASMDIYGRPNGWCEVCWRGEQIARLKRSLYNVCEAYGGHLHAKNCVSESMENPI